MLQGVLVGRATSTAIGSNGSEVTKRRVQAQTVCARSENDVVPAAVASVPVAATVVVSIVAVLVAHEPRMFASALAGHCHGWVEACALCAVLVRVGSTTAITAVPVATALVVTVVTEVVLHPVGVCALAHAALVFFGVVRIVGVLAAAVNAVEELSGNTRATTAVAIVPVAAADVVAVVAVTISNEVRAVTRGDTGGLFVVRIQAEAVSAVSQNGVVVTAVAAIPVAAANIVAVVTVTVALVSFCLALAAAEHLTIVGRVEAQAVGAVRVEMLGSAAVTTVPVAAAVVVVVIAVPVTEVVLVATAPSGAVVPP